jgi:hypothetical protein
MVEPPADKTLVYWGTPQVEEALDVSEWPRVYRERNAIQELSFKGMIAHGGLEINHGRKTIMGPDRHHQRKQAHLEASLETAQARVAKKEEALTSQQAKVAESEAKGHGRRLEQRQGRRPRRGWPRRKRLSRANRPRWPSPRPRGMVDVWSSARAR